MHARTDRIGLGLTAILFFSFLAFAGNPAEVIGQTVMVNGQPMSIEEARAMSGSRRGGPSQPPTASPPQDGQPKPSTPPAGAQPAGATPSGEKKDEKAGSITRPEKPAKEPDPDEFEIALDEHNLVPAFNFQGQPWPAVLAWYAKLSNCSLDWQEMPSDYVNVFTLQPQPLDEVRNILNRFLLPRGYTILQRDRTVSLFKIETMDPGLVEQIDEIDLFNRKPYDFKKVAFKLPKSMAADKVKEDLKQVLSPKARVLPFITSQQVLVIDAVANLRTVSEMLNLERAKEEGKSPLRQFRLTYRRAEDVIDILYVTLGMDPKTKPSQQEMQVRQQELQIMQQIAQRGTDVSKMLKPDGPPVYLTYNSQLNSIIANAPEEQMKMIEETILWLDVPLGGNPSEAPHAIAGMVGNRVLMTHKLRTLNPVTFKTTVDDIGDLSPFTTVQADQAGQSLIVQGIKADQEKIAQLIKELDGEERIVKVLQLRKYPAADAAVSIRELIFGKAEQKKSSDPNEAYYNYLASMNSRSGQPQKVDPNEGFFINADELNNRLLVKANKRELAQIYSLLKELGEIPDETRDGMAMRVLDPTGNDVLERIKKAWAQSGGNPLFIEGAANATPAAKAGDDAKNNEPAQPAADVGVSNDRPMATPSVFARFAAVQVAASESTNEAAEAAQVAGQATQTTSNASTESNSEEAPVSATASVQPAAALPAKAPVSISVTPDGRLIIQSSDADAVAQLEALIAEMSPPPQRIKRFPLKHTSASYMLWNLQDVYKEELKAEGEMVRDYYTGRLQQTAAEQGSGLAKRRKLMVTYDGPSNSILVANATNAQLYEIDQLIKELDQPSPEALVRARVSATVKIRYSRASIIAAALKEVYIDLLSTRDQAFATEEAGRSTSSGSRSMTEIKFGDPANSNVAKPPRIPVAFNGELSIGFDDVSNNILISCREELYDGVVSMINKLDEESAPKMSVVVHAVEGSVAAASLQKSVSDSVGRPWLGGRPEDQAGGRGAGPQRGGENPQGNQPQPNRGNRGRRSGNTANSR